jgi:hypothetical protein
MARLRGPKSVQVGLNLHVLQISDTWEPNDDERKAASELHVELVARIAVVPLRADEGLFCEALASLYTNRHDPRHPAPLRPRCRGTQARRPVQLRRPRRGHAELCAAARTGSAAPRP